MPVQVLLRMVVGALLGTLLFSGRAAAQISFTWPAPVDSRAQDPYPVVVQVTSPYELTSVRAVAGSHELTLTKSGPYYAGSLPLTGEPFGTQLTLTVTATDLYGTAANVSRAITVDRLPVLTVTSPI